MLQKKKESMINIIKKKTQTRNILNEFSWHVTLYIIYMVTIINSGILRAHTT